MTWVWQGGIHTVYSSTGGLPNGIFQNGTATGKDGYTYSVTFDAAFVAANPVPNDVYEYICTIHSTFGQTGTVKVEFPASVVTYGCTAPVNTLQSLSGSPTVGGSWTVGVTNNLATQSAGALAFVAASATAAPGYPCGPGLPGFGMSGAGASGELLISVAPPNPLLQVGPLPWDGVSPTPFPLTIPSLPSLAGANIFLQGLMFDPAPAATVQFALTSGIAATIGA